MKILFPLVTLSALASPAAAQSEKTVKLVRSSSSELESSDLRSKKNWQFTFGLGDLHPFLGPRARVSAFIDGDSLVFAEISGGIAGQALAPVIRWASTETESRKLGLGYKLFWGNSFYVEGSGFYRRMSRLNDPYRFTSDAAGVEFKIGNQWQWNRFTLGVDWFGYHIPVAVFGEKSEKGDGSAYLQSRERDFRDLGKRVAVTLLGFYIGFSF